MIRLALLLALLLALAGGCTHGEEQARGGADDLPGALPEGATFAEPPESALDAPPFTAELVDGTDVAGAELWEDRPLVLLFTGTYCERCRDVHRDVAAAVEEHDGAVALLGLVADDDRADAADYAQELGLEHPLGIVSERVWLSYAAREPPVAVLVAPGGKVVRGWPGGVERGALADALAELVERP